LERAGAGGVAIWGDRRPQQQQRAATDKYTPVITEESGSCYAWRSSMAGAHKASKGEICKDLFPLNPQSHQKRIRDLEKKSSGNLQKLSGI
jgi:hypothetical protein